MARMTEIQERFDQGADFMRGWIDRIEWDDGSAGGGRGNWRGGGYGKWWGGGKGNWRR